jgi:hypothetical protein
MYSIIPIHWNIKSAPVSPGRSRVGPALYVFSLLEGSSTNNFKVVSVESSRFAMWRIIYFFCCHLNFIFVFELLILRPRNHLNYHFNFECSEKLLYAHSKFCGNCSVIVDSAALCACKQKILNQFLHTVSNLQLAFMICIEQLLPHFEYA